MHKLLKQAFTLIELLVVIAIIGILSGLIIVGMNGMTQKATIAKAQVFSNSLRNSLMMNIIGEWKFDGSTGDNLAATPNDVLDTWGGINSGTIPTVPAIPTVRTGSNCISGSCLSFDGGDYINCGGASLNIVDSITLSTWVKTNSNGNYQVVAGKGGWGIDSNQYILYVHSGEARFTATNGTAEFTAFKAGVGASQWHYLVGTYSGDTKIFKIFVDAIVGTDATLTGTKSTTSESFSIGAARTSTPIGFFPGIIDDVRIYNAAIPTSQIKEQYYAGLNSLLAKGEITKQEYQNRIGELAIEL